MRVVLREGKPAVGRNLPGRGAWICAGSDACFELARKRRAFQRALRADIPEGDLDGLRHHHDFPGSVPAARD